VKPSIESQIIRKVGRAACMIGKRLIEETSKLIFERWKEEAQTLMITSI